MANCLVGCVSQYQCSALFNTIEGHNISPCVKIFFDSPDDPSITVGNQSAPFTGNHAVVKSMEYSSGGGGKGHLVKVDIADEQGGNFLEFAERINKCIEKSRQEYRMKVKFGWSVANCNGRSEFIESPTLHFLPTTLSVDFSSGVTKFAIEGTDTLSASFGVHNDQVFGDDEHKMPLKQAIRKLAEEVEPSFLVRFERIVSGGTRSQWDFRGFPGDGPEMTWEADSQHKLATIMKWIEPYMTDRGKGITPIWDTTAPEPTLVLLEDPKPLCYENRDCNDVIASYVVNGGSCSPVIKFSPKLNWPFSAGNTLVAPTGNSGGPGTGETTKKDKSECSVQSRETGMQQSVSISRQAWETYGPKRATKETARTQNKHEIANKDQGILTQTISAELQIQGDPRPQFVDAVQWQNKYISLAVINPFHIDGGKNGECGDWTARPGCNNVLSNKRWRITGVNHTIKEGSYVTTFSLSLEAAEVDIAGGSPLGGPGSGGWVPPNTC